MDLVKQMSDVTIMGGWDVVCCLDAEAINHVLKETYEADRVKLKSNSQGFAAGDLYTSNIIIKHTTGFRFVTEVPHSRITSVMICSPRPFSGRKG